MPKIPLQLTQGGLEPCAIETMTDALHDAGTFHLAPTLGLELLLVGRLAESVQLELFLCDLRAEPHGQLALLEVPFRR